MPSTHRPRGDGVPVCGDCGQRHLTAFGTQACDGHVVMDRDSYDPTTRHRGRRLDTPRACRKPPRRGSNMCDQHGAQTPQVKAAAAQRESERKAREAIVRKLGDAGTPVTDPIAKLCEIAGRAVAFMEALSERVNVLDDQADQDAVRAEIALYGRVIKDAAAVVESIIRMGIAERLAKAEAEQTQAIVAFIDAVLTDLGHNPREPEVAGVVARRLELVS